MNNYGLISVILVLILITLVSFLVSSEIRQSPLNNEILHKNGFVISYNEAHEQPNWVFYKMTNSDIECETKAKRKNRFKEDLEVSTKSATVDDYYKSGYDRGHLKPAADESCDQTQMNETFLMSNISPQVPGFNRGIWKSLESHVRDLLYNNDSLYVYTAGVLTNDLPTIGDNHVSIPKQYYKIVYMFKNNHIYTESYLIPNAKSNQPLSTYLVSIEDVEEYTGINFPDLTLSFSFPK